MTAKPIQIISVSRTTGSGESETLDLMPGVNAIVGLKDTGKSGWLQTISYLLGDTDPPEKALGQPLSEKFDTASLQMTVGGEPVTLQRRWKEHGAKHKVFVNEEGVSSSDFSELFLHRLGIPVVHYPRGNPWSGAGWPELSWRELFRHIYREERFWSDLADKQYADTQHACLLQFLGVADKLYPQALRQEIDKRKALSQLEAGKQQYEQILQQAAKDIVPDPSISTAPTPDAIDQGVARIRDDIERHGRRRETVLAELLQPGPNKSQAPADVRLGERRAEVTAGLDRERGRLADVEKRVAELTPYRDEVRAELNRLKRVETAGSLLADLKVTCCPFCDQKVRPGREQPGQCYVCQQPMPAGGADEMNGAKKRLLFEVEQLTGEASELDDLIGELARERNALFVNIRRLNEELAEIEVLLRPVRAAVAAAMPPEIAMLDTQVGQLEEKIAQLQRLRRCLDVRDELARQIDQLRAEVQTFNEEVDGKYASVPFEELSDLISDGINEYLNYLSAADPTGWPHQPIRVELGKRSLRLLVGKAPWTTLGATSIGYVALGYHYALLKLSGRDGFNYPGIALIDFPITLAKNVSIADKENYLIEPFVQLAKQNPAVQVIVCGRAFKKLKGANRIELRRVWRQGEAPVLPEAENEDHNGRKG